MAKQYRTSPSITIKVEDIQRILQLTYDDAWYRTLPAMGAFVFCLYLERQHGSVTAEQLSMLLKISQHRTRKLIRVLVDADILCDTEENR